MKPENLFKRYLIYSQIAVYATFLICIALMPSSLSANSGVSYFGVHKLTVIPFSLGMLASAHYILRALHFLPTRPVEYRWLSLALRTIALLIVGIIITPYSFGSWFDFAHRTFGITLFSLQLLLTLWLVVFIKRSWLNFTLLAIQFAGGLISLIYLNPAQGFLIQGQLLFQMAFSAILMSNMDSFKYQDT